MELGGSSRYETYEEQEERETRRGGGVRVLRTPHTVHPVQSRTQSCKAAPFGDTTCRVATHDGLQAQHGSVVCALMSKPSACHPATSARLDEQHGVKGLGITPSGHGAPSALLSSGLYRL